MAAPNQLWNRVPTYIHAAGHLMTPPQVTWTQNWIGNPGAPSGEFYFWRHMCPLACDSSSGAVIRCYIYATAITGSPTWYLRLYNDSGADAPGSFVDVASPFTAAAGWNTIPVLNGFGYRNDGQPGWLCISNGTNPGGSTTWAAGGCVRETYFTGVSEVLERYLKCGYYDPAIPAVPARSFENLSGVVVYDVNGDKHYLGNPYVDRKQPTGWLTNGTWFGNRVKFETDTWVSGVMFGDWSGSWISHYAIYTTGGGLITYQTANYHSQTVVKAFRHDPQKLTANTYYDFVLQKTGGVMAGLVGTVPGGPPADVVACKPPNVAGFVEGLTPGSFTLDTDSIAPLAIIVDSVDPPAGTGASARLIG